MNSFTRRPGIVNEHASSESNPNTNHQSREKLPPGKIELSAIPIASIDEVEKKRYENGNDKFESFPLPKTYSWTSTFILWIVFLLVITTGMGTKIIYDTTAGNYWLSLPILILSIVLMIYTINVFAQEWKAINQVKKITLLRKNLIESIRNNNHSMFIDNLIPLVDRLGYYSEEQVNSFKKAVNYDDPPYMVFQQFENIVLNHIDNLALELIKKESIIGGVGVAIIPHPALDGLFALWRGMRLMRKISHLYGHTITPLSSPMLMRSVILNATIAAGMEELARIVVEGNQGNNLFPSVLGPISEAGITGMRLHRLGIMTRSYCRPLPFNWKITEKRF
jgi:uncharacterized membrane protein YcjF (UPF0283 family)